MKIGIVGGGLAVRDLHVPVLRDLDLIESVEMVTASRPESGRAAAEWLQSQGASRATSRSLEEMLSSDVDAVLVAVPISETSAVTEALLRSGKAVLAEKPIATDV